MPTDINFKDLTKELPYKWRVQSFSKFKPEATCVAYVDSRDVQKLLDEVAGPENWQDEYYAVKNNLFCKIGIRVNGEWTWKGDCGTESNVDKEKGEASDAFKRAAVKWGIGRFLYDLGMFKLKTDKKLGESPGNPMPLDDNGQKVWDITKHINAVQAKAKANKATPPKAAPAKVEPTPPAAPAPITAASEFEATEPTWATSAQKEEIITLLQNPVIIKTEREKMAAALGKLNIEQAGKSIQNLKDTIKHREAINAELNEQQ